jgi:predicted O-linked N-acetylglucosamine transferase (SPINDLY family)
LDQAIAARPDYVDALNNRGGVQLDLRRLEEALASYDRALAAKPDDSHALSGVADCAAKLCDWPKRAAVDAMLTNHIAVANGFIAPFVLFGYRDDPALELQCARHYTDSKFPVLPPPLWTGEIWRHDKIRIAYLAADYRSHALGYLVPDLFETHDRSRFEVTGISYGIDDGSEIRKRIAGAFETFHDVPGLDDAQIAGLVHDLEIDIAVDLQAYTGSERPGILARRPAPIHANYIGFPGTMGAPFLDYIMTDNVVAPFEHQQFFAEKIVHLRDCYLVNDRKRRIAPRAPTRHEVGLPEHGFVFCCFNNNWKITPVFFDIWMRLLHEVEGSVLWLVRDNEGAERNLRREARQRGIDPSRLVFADRIPSSQHLARHPLADLFLDTLPYNAHSTAVDALRMGTPLLTCMGTAFPARVAASHLHAIGIPELIVSNLEEYHALALKLARDPALFAALKAKLWRNRDTYPLLDTERATRGIEAAYTTMWEIWQRGEPPRSFAVPPLE